MNYTDEVWTGMRITDIRHQGINFILKFIEHPPYIER